MQIVTNKKLISKNAKIGVWGQIIGFLIMLVSAILTFQTSVYVGPAYITLALGILLSQYGIYYANRWSRRPRSDELLDKVLKGLDKKYTLYHYSSPVAHLLVGPAGTWCILTRAIKGKVFINTSNGRWKHSGGGTLFKLFGQEGLGRPDLDITTEIKRIKNMLKASINVSPPINAVVVFTHDEIDVNIPISAGNALHLQNLKSFFIKQSKKGNTNHNINQEINQLLMHD